MSRRHFGRGAWRLAVTSLRCEERRWIFGLFDGPLRLAARADHPDVHDTMAAENGGHSPWEYSARPAVRAPPVKPGLTHVVNSEPEIYHG